MSDNCNDGIPLVTEGIQFRLQKLEKQNRNIREVMVFVSISLGVVVLVAQAVPKTNIVESGKFELKDKDGKIRAVLASAENGSVLRFFDVAGKVRTTLGVSEDGAPFLTLSDREEKKRAILCLFKGESPGLGLLDENEKLLFSLIVSKTSQVLEFLDHEGKELIALSLREDRGALTLRDKKGKASAALQVDKEGLALLRLTDPDGTERSTFNIFKDGSPGLTLCDKEGKIRLMLEILKNGLPGLRFYNDDGKKNCVTLGITEEGMPYLELIDSKGKVLIKAP